MSAGIRGFAVGAAMSVMTSGALADPPREPATSSLGWLRLRGAEECVSSQDLAQDVEVRMGRAVFVSAARADVSIEGHVERLGKGFRATIVARDSKGTLLGSRELKETSGSCAPLREQVAFVIAVMIDPDAATNPHAGDAGAPTPAASSEVAPAPAPPPASPRPARTATVPPVAPAEPLRFDSGASLVGAVGLMPGAALGAQVDGILHFPHFIPLEGRGGVFPDRSARVDRAERTFAFGYVAGGLCPLWLHGPRWSAFACVASYLGLMHATGTERGVKLSAENDVFLAPALDGRVELRLVGPFALRFGVAGLVPIVRPPYRVTDANGSRVEAHRVFPVMAMLDVGLGLVIP